MTDASIYLRGIGALRLVRVIGVLDLATSVRLRLALFDQLDSGHTELVVDLSAVTIMDAGSCRVLLDVHTEAQQHDGRLRAPGAQGVVLQVLEITGAAKTLRAYDDLDEILRTAHHADPHTHDDAWTGGWGTDVTALLQTMAALPADHPDRTALRQRVVTACLPAAERLARRFRNLNEPATDLRQVAVVGLLKAVDRYDPAMGTEFGAYATPTIVGELKRHFRDKGWGVRVPRRLQELRLRVNAARHELHQTLQRSPTVADLAHHLDLDEEDIIEAIAAATAYRPGSLDIPVAEDHDTTLADSIGQPDGGYDAIEFRESLRPLLAALPHREQRILAMRFYGDLTQAQIATELGISQMHVSRLLAATLIKLRRNLLADS